MRPLREESVAPLTRRMPRVLLYKGFAARNPTLLRRLSVIERKARWEGRAIAVLCAEVRR